MAMLIVIQPNTKTMLCDPIGKNLVAAGAAAVLGDGERPAIAAVMPGPAHQDDRVGIGENVALGDRLRSSAHRA